MPTHTLQQPTNIHSNQHLSHNLLDFHAAAAKKKMVPLLRTIKPLSLNTVSLYSAISRTAQSISSSSRVSHIPLHPPISLSLTYTQRLDARALPNISYQWRASVVTRVSQVLRLYVYITHDSHTEVSERERERAVTRDCAYSEHVAHGYAGSLPSARAEQPVRHASSSPKGADPKTR